MGKTLCEDGVTQAARAASPADSDPAPAPAPTPEPEPTPTVQTADEPAASDDELVRLVEELNVDETLDLVATGEYTTTEVLAAEQSRQKPRKTVVDALTAITEQE